MSRQVMSGGCPPAMSPAEHPLLQGADRAGVEAILASIKPRRMRRGEVLATPMSEPALNLVLGGVVHSCVCAPDGRRVLLDLIGPGGMDGYLSLSGRRLVTSEAAAQPTVVLQLSRIRWTQLMELDSQLAMNATELTMERLARRERQLAALAHRDLVHRIAAGLMLLADSSAHSEQTHGEVIFPFRVTHQNLADMVNATRESITVNLRTLRDAGAVLTSSGHLRGVRRGVLQQVLNGYEQQLG